MNVAWGIVIVVFGLLAWLGQAFSWLAPVPASRLGLTEKQDSVDPAFWADVRGEGAWDSLTLWTLPLAGLLLIIDDASWPQWGLIGGAIFVYFGGRGVLSRLEARRAGIRIGSGSAVRSAWLMLPLWALIGLITIVVSLEAL